MKEGGGSGETGDVVGSEPTESAPTTTADGRWRALALLSVAELFAMSLWFSASAVAPELAARWGLSGAETAWLTTAVQLGFVAGALASAAFTLSDTVQPRILFAASSVVGAAATVGVAAVDAFLPAVALRFLTGVALAGVYPPGMKVVAGWFRSGRGLAIGTLVGALTVGSALPHLLRALGAVNGESTATAATGVADPRLVLLGAAALALVGAGVALLVRPGPYQSPAAPFDPRAVGRILRDRPTMLANVGYFGHMWELYAVWTWLPVYLLASAEATADPLATPPVLALLAFGAIATGAVGAVAAGRLADRWGRTTVTSASMVASGAACLGAGAAFGAPVLVLAPFVLGWGLVVVADSAQFSACVTELADGEYVGTALTLQTAFGFLLTVVAIQSVPVVAGVVGWRFAFAPLAVGPAVGTAAMLRLRRRPEAVRLAGGRG